MGFGRRESGKTDFSLLIAFILWKAGIIEHFASNIKIYDSPFPIKHITNLPDLEEWARDTPGRKLFILDEAGKSLRRRTPMSKLNIELLDNLQILRKYRLSIIMLAPADKYIDAASLGSDVLDGYFIKPYFKNPKVGIYHDLLEKFHKNLSDIPPTPVKFDTWDVAPFNLKGKKSPKFDSKEVDDIYAWCHGKTYEDVGWENPNECNRKVRQFCRRIFDWGLYDLLNPVGVKGKENGLQTSP